MLLLVLMSLIRHTELGVFSVNPTLNNLPIFMTALSSKMISHGLAISLSLRDSSQAFRAALAAARCERALIEFQWPLGLNHFVRKLML